jgi:hypothetical protein
MSDTRAARGTEPRAPTTEVPDSWDGKSWIDRTQVHGSRLPPGRHNAITGTLHSYSNYKSWADKVRTNWHPSDKEPK